MTRLVIFYSLVLALSAIPSGLAGPACAHKHYRTADCVAKCKEKWGWIGSMMGTDRWGSVIQKVDESVDAWDAIISEACGLSVTTAPSATVSDPSSPTFVTQPGPVIGAGSDPAESAPLSSPYSVSSSVIVVSPSASSSVISSSVVSSSEAGSTITTTATPSSTRFITSVRPTPSKEPATTTKAPATTKAPVTTKSPATTQAPPPSTAPPADSGSGSTPSGDIQAYLSAHNSARANHGASPLVWSDELAIKAQQWANGCKFQHSGGSLGPYGENLAAGTGSAYGVSQAIKSWTDEASDYNANSPQPSHFTQVIWKGSQQLGCAVQECDGIFSAQYGKAKFYVCEYFPAGNVIGEFAQNVLV